MFEEKKRRRGRPAYLRSPYDSPLRDGNRDRLIGFLTERATKTLLCYLMETNLNLYHWLLMFLKANPIPKNGNWDEVSGETFLRTLLAMPIAEAKFQTGRDPVFDNVVSCGVDPRNIAQRIMEIRTQLATEFIQDLNAVAEENSLLLRETLSISLESTVTASHTPLATKDGAAPPVSTHPEMVEAAQQPVTKAPTAPPSASKTPPTKSSKPADIPKLPTTPASATPKIPPTRYYTSMTGPAQQASTAAGATQPPAPAAPAGIDSASTSSTSLAQATPSSSGPAPSLTSDSAGPADPPSATSASRSVSEAGSKGTDPCGPLGNVSAAPAAAATGASAGPALDMFNLPPDIRKLMGLPAAKLRVPNSPAELLGLVTRQGPAAVAPASADPPKATKQQPIATPLPEARTAAPAPQPSPSPLIVPPASPSPLAAPKPAGADDVSPAPLSPAVPEARQSDAATVVQDSGSPGVSGKAVSSTPAPLSPSMEVQGSAPLPASEAGEDPAVDKGEK